MKDLVNKIIENNALFIGVIVALSVILLLLIFLIIKSAKSNKKINIYEEDLEDEDLKKVKNVKKEDIIETPDEELEDELELDEDDLFNFDDEETGYEPVKEEQDDDELARRYHEEEEKEIEEVKEQSKGSEIERLITKMEEDSKLKPEDVVEKFEKEQEAQSIISYKELVNAVKNRTEDVYEDELESQPLATVSDLMEELENSNIYDDEEEEEVIPPKEEKKPEVRETKFRKTEVISPVFGRVEVDDTPSYDYYEEPEKEEEEVIEEKNRVVSDEETIDLSDVDLSDYRFTGKKEEQEGVTALDEIYKHMADNMVKEEKAPNKEAVEKLSRNEEFLQSLKDFRNKL